MKNKQLIIRCFVSDPQTGVGFWDEFDLKSFDNCVEDFLIWYSQVLALTDFCLDYCEVV